MGVSSHVDWISVTHKSMSVDDATPPWLRGMAYKFGAGRHNYLQSRKYACGLCVMDNPHRKGMGVHLIYSGDVLHQLESQTGVSRNEFMHWHIANGATFSRVDIAVDAMDEPLDINELYQAACDGLCRTKIRSKPQLIEKARTPETLYIGSTKTRKNLVRVYNKAIEQGAPSLNWIRVEAEQRGIRATRTAHHIDKADYTHKSMVSVVNGIVDFSEHVAAWRDVMNEPATPIRARDDKPSATRKWLIESVAPALALELLNDAAFADEFLNAVHSATNKLIYDMKQKAKPDDSD